MNAPEPTAILPMDSLRVCSTHRQLWPCSGGPYDPELGVPCRARTFVPLPDEGVVCTGLTATWCPIHGDCNCARRPDGDIEFEGGEHSCPLHAINSPHAEDGSDTKGAES